MGGESRLLTFFFVVLMQGPAFTCFPVVEGVSRAFSVSRVWRWAEASAAGMVHTGSAHCTVRTCSLLTRGRATAQAFAPHSQSCTVQVRSLLVQPYLVIDTYVHGGQPQRICACYGAGRRPCLLSARRMLAHPPTTTLLPQREGCLAHLASPPSPSWRPTPPQPHTPPRY